MKKLLALKITLLQIEINEEEIISPQELEFVDAKRTVIKKVFFSC